MNDESSIQSLEETTEVDSANRRRDVEDTRDGSVTPEDSAEIVRSPKSNALPRNRQKIELLTGSGNDLTDEINQLLATRLRLASLLLFFGFLTFLIYSLFYPGTGTNLKNTMLWAHVGITVVTGAIGSRSCMNKKMQGKHMRIAELIVFGGSALFFLLTTLGRCLNAADHGFFEFMNGPWMLLIFTYALFIPNRWTRAACVIIPMALCPTIAMAIAWGISDKFRETLAKPDFENAFVTTFLSMAFSGTIAIYGQRTIRQLRTAAFEARQFGQYKLTNLIGSGGMGEVYEAEHMLLKRNCAIKVIKPAKAGNAVVLERFEREVQLTAQLTHWNTVEIYDYGRTEDGTFYYVMEYLSGMNLQEMVDQSGPLDERRVAHLLAQTCDALAEAHAVGMVHRDLKPANIFAAEIGNKFDVAKLLDFGLVAQLEESERIHGSSQLELTQRNVILGSPLYMSPEQASGYAADYRSDVYSIGVVSYFLLTGKPPFQGKTAIDTIVAHAKEDPPALPESISAEIKRIVFKCLAKNPDERYQSISELAEAFLECVKEWNWSKSEAWWLGHESLRDPNGNE